MVMKNSERYNSITEEKYSKKDISYYLLRVPADRIIIPMISKIKDEKILEVGAGYGYYTRLLKDENYVEVADINPEMCRKLGVTVYECEAQKLTKAIKKKYNKIFSFWMTEYLTLDEFESFVDEAYELLEEGGELCTTVYFNKGLGILYIKGAKLKGIRKYCYDIEKLENKLKKYESHDVRLIKSKLGIPYAGLVYVRK